MGVGAHPIPGGWVYGTGHRRGRGGEEEDMRKGRTRKGDVGGGGYVDGIIINVR